MRASKRQAPVDRHRGCVDCRREHASVQAFERRRGRSGGGVVSVRRGVDHCELLKVAGVGAVQADGRRLVAHRHHVLWLATAAVEHARLEGHVVVVGLVFEAWKQRRE